MLSVYVGVDVDVDVTMATITMIAIIQPTVIPASFFLLNLSPSQYQDV